MAETFKSPRYTDSMSSTSFSCWVGSDRRHLSLDYLRLFTGSNLDFKDEKMRGQSAFSMAVEDLMKLAQERAALMRLTRKARLALDRWLGEVERNLSVDARAEF